MNTDPKDLVPLREAHALFPKRDGKTPSHNTIYRWMTTGVHGVKLWSVKIGQALYTSRDAVQAFIEAQNPDAADSRGDAVDDGVAERAADRARKMLEAS